MNCSTDICTRTALVREPLPLCRTCTLQVLANYANANLAASATPEVRGPAPEAVRSFQDAITVALYLNLGRRPKSAEIREALVSADLAPVSRPTAQRIRDRVEAAHPHLRTSNN